MGRRHLTFTAIAAGACTALTLAVGPHVSSGVSPMNAVHTSSSTSTAFTPAGSARPNGTPYLAGAAGMLLAGAGLVVVRRRASH